MRFGDSLQEGLADAVLDVPVVARGSYEELKMSTKVFIISPEVTFLVTSFILTYSLPSKHGAVAAPKF